LDRKGVFFGVCIDIFFFNFLSVLLKLPVLNI
jgi:hypothetical protein